MTASDPGARRRSLSDDLLADLEQGPPRTPTPSASATRSSAPTSGTTSSAAPGAVRRAPAAAPPPVGPADDAPQTPTVELRITPRAWASAGVEPLPDGGGVAVSLGPLRVSLWRNRG